MNKLIVKIQDEIHELGIVVNFIVFKNIQNQKSAPSFSDYQQQILSGLMPNLSKEMLKNDPVLEGYRNLRTELGLSRNKYTCSSEALLKFLLNKSTLPQVNLLVDIYNLLSVKTHVSIGAHDLEKIEQYLTLGMTSGDELFIPMGSDKPLEIPKGEYAYIDGRNEVLCRLDHRQCHKTRITEFTQSCLLIVQGNPQTSHKLINAVTKELIQLIHEYCNGDAEVVETNQSG